MTDFHFKVEAKHSAQEIVSTQSTLIHFWQVFRDGSTEFFAEVANLNAATMVGEPFVVDGVGYLNLGKVLTLRGDKCVELIFIRECSGESIPSPNAVPALMVKKLKAEQNGEI